MGWFRDFFTPVPRGPAPPLPVRDGRVWNEDWKVGDTAECILPPDSGSWHDCVPPWSRPTLHQRFTVTGFTDYTHPDANIRAYMLHFKEWPTPLSCNAFRKVRTVETDVSASESVLNKITATPGKEVERKVPKRQREKVK